MPQMDRTTIHGADEFGPAEIGQEEVGPAEVGGSEIWLNLWILPPPLVPDLDSLLQDRDTWVPRTLLLH